MPVKERKEREKAARREAILEAAKTVFAEKGLLAATIDEIAERAELGKGTIYLYFKSKEAMYIPLVDEGLARLAHRFSQVIDPSGPADDNLRRLCDAYYRFYRDEPHYFKLLFFCSHPDVRTKAGGDSGEEQARECLQGVAAIVQKGINDGIFSPSVDAWKAAAVAWASAVGIVFIFEQDPAHASLLGLQLEDLLKTNTELFIRGISRAR
jgi:AcrR family transcriptional regulator